ncbi:MAG TPA: TIGR00730 family Rossman fold protein [Deltaproteobacteria bacterium]|nr:TIGR00730 family Rossman fold protein [Deltaproteobacteria bacterium]
MHTFRSICVYCGSRHGRDPAYTAAARRLGRHLAQHNIRLIYGGGSVGLMGEVATAVMEAGGEVVGVIPQKLVDLEVGKTDLTELVVVPDMHARKKQMADRSDGFVALPGGYGTLEELFEAITWTQLEYHRKPIGLLDVGGYYAPLIALLDHMVEQGFVRPAQRGIVQLDTEPGALLQRMGRARLPQLRRWMQDV